MDADCAYFMPFWINSEGAMLENKLCELTFIQTFYSIDGLPDISNPDAPFFLDEMLK